MTNVFVLDNINWENTWVLLNVSKWNSISYPISLDTISLLPLSLIFLLMWKTIITHCPFLYTTIILYPWNAGFYILTSPIKGIKDIENHQFIIIVMFSLYFFFLFLLRSILFTNLTSLLFVPIYVYVYYHYPYYYNCVSFFL